MRRGCRRWRRKSRNFWRRLPLRRSGLPVSTVTGEGLPAVEKALGSLAVKNRPTDRLFRLAVDWSFIAPGRGLVATARRSPAWSDPMRPCCSTGVPFSSISARVRGIEIAETAVGEASAGMRCAIDLAGADIERGAARRGLARGPGPILTSQLDIVLRAGSDRRRLEQPSSGRSSNPFSHRCRRPGRTAGGAGTGATGDRRRLLGAGPAFGTRPRGHRRPGGPAGCERAGNPWRGWSSILSGRRADGPARNGLPLADLREPDDRCALRDAVKAGPVERPFSRADAGCRCPLSPHLDDMPDVVTMPGSDLLWTGAQWTAFTEQCGAAIDDTHRERPELAGPIAPPSSGLPDRPPPQLLDAALGALVRVGALRHRFGIGPDRTISLPSHLRMKRFGHGPHHS